MIKKDPLYKLKHDWDTDWRRSPFLGYKKYRYLSPRIPITIGDITVYGEYVLIEYSAYDDFTICGGDTWPYTGQTHEWKWDEGRFVFDLSSIDNKLATAIDLTPNGGSFMLKGKAMAMKKTKGLLAKLEKYYWDGNEYIYLGHKWG